MDFCGIQVGRGVGADEAANDGRGKKGAMQRGSKVRQRDNLISLAWEVTYLRSCRKEKTPR